VVTFPPIVVKVRDRAARVFMLTIAGIAIFDTGASMLQFVGELYYLLVPHHHQLMLGADRALAWFVPPTRRNR